MAIIVRIEAPDSLILLIKKAIDEGRVRTWSYDLDGDLTHTPEQWRNKAWLHPRIYRERGELRFGFWESEDGPAQKDLWGLYHGRFIEMLLTHFRDAFTDVKATANKVEPDSFD